MATHDSSVEAHLKRLLAGEVERRRQFSQELQELLNRKTRELRLEEKGEDQASIPELMKQVEDEDKIVSLRLQECQQLCASDVSRREKDGAAQRDSGYSPSAPSSSNVADVKRQAVHIRDSQILPGLAAASANEQQGFPELVPDNASISSDCEAPGSTRKPTEHTESDSNSSADRDDCTNL